MLSLYYTYYYLVVQLIKLFTTLHIYNINQVPSPILATFLHYDIYICRCKTGVPRSLKDFMEKKNITFVGVDIRGDRRVLRNEWLDIPIEYHIDIQDIYKIEGARYGRAGMAAMAGKLINKNPKP